jgi:hypothetical protein
MIWASRAVLAIVFPIFPLIFALFLHFSISLMGFPDNHVTDYEKAVITPDYLLFAFSIVTALYLAYRAFRAIDLKDVFHMGVTLSLFVILFFSARYAVDLYLIDYLHLDFGQGG